MNAAAEAIAPINAVAAKCIDTLLPSASKRAADKVLAGGFLTVPDVASVEPWRSIMERNSARPLPPAIPLLLVQGGADVIVQPAVGHGWIASKNADAVTAWIADRFASRPAPESCGTAKD
ncbi:hypothetical protein [Sandaracinobacteroides hominis]|uniref:hypothetical protein n=1 Tax=Sandaracinobacteroides hominis TaxID=2780086 RepID=UPI0018F3C1C7|nr:hypothetical protein [Sandaracinobacteroides hominis]